MLRERPQGRVSPGCFETTEVPVAPLEPGQALLEVHYVGIDPTIRGWLDERGNYMAGVAIGEVIRANGAGVVVETTDPDRYPLGAAFMAFTGWQEYRVLQAHEDPPVTRLPEGARLVDPLNLLGHIGITAYIGVTEVARPEPGETFVVSAAAGGVGSIAGQIAKLRGARVIGIAGSAAKCAWVVDELGFDGCIDYKTQDVAAQLKVLAPTGVDVFFDNVGGAVLDAVIRRLATGGRVVLCGDLSTYDSDAPAAPSPVLKYVMGRRARLEGFNALDYWSGYAQAAQQLAQWRDEGRIVAREHVLDGVEQAPEALVRLFSGDHLGKLVVRVRPDGA